MDDLIDAIIDGIWDPMCDALFADRSWWARVVILLVIAGVFAGAIWMVAQ